MRQRCSQRCGRHRRGVSRDYERQRCLNGSLSDPFSPRWQRLIRGQFWKTLSQKWPNLVGGGDVIMALWCADLLSRGSGRGNQPGGQIWLRPGGQMTSVASYQSKRETNLQPLCLERWSQSFRKRRFVSMCIKNTRAHCGATRGFSGTVAQPRFNSTHDGIYLPPLWFNVICLTLYWFLPHRLITWCNL